MTGGVEREGKVDLERVKCGFCPKTYSCKRHMERHRRQAHPLPGDKKQTESFQCSLCDSVFAQANLLNKHVKFVHEVKPYKCSESGRSESSRYIEKSGIPECYHAYGNVLHLKKHLSCAHYDYEDQDFLRKLFTDSLDHEPSPEPPAGKYPISNPLPVQLKYTCLVPHCPSEYFTSYRKLKNHWKKHLNPYQCGECEGKFLSNKELVEHKRRIHNRCNICGVVCERSNLARHISLHERPKLAPHPFEYYHCNHQGCVKVFQSVKKDFHQKSFRKSDYNSTFNKIITKPALKGLEWPHPASPKSLQQRLFQIFPPFPKFPSR